jgi:hypothetical protein
MRRSRRAHPTRPRGGGQSFRRTSAPAWNEKGKEDAMKNSSFAVLMAHLESHGGKGPMGTLFTPRYECVAGHQHPPRASRRHPRAPGSASGIFWRRWCRPGSFRVHAWVEGGQSNADRAHRKGMPSDSGPERGSLLPDALWCWNVPVCRQSCRTVPRTRPSSGGFTW